MTLVAEIGIPPNRNSFDIAMTLRVALGLGLYPLTLGIDGPTPVHG